MNFKEIRKKIEYYEKKHNEAFMICFDHDVNEVKAKMLDDAKDNKEYALAAIYDFCFIYRYANEKEEIKEYLDKHISQLENAKEISEDQKRLNRIYLTILNACLSLQGKDRLNLIKYGTQKKAEHERKDSLSQKKENKRVVNELSEKLLSDYKKYKEDKEVKENSIVKYRNNKQVKYFAGITLLIFLPILFSLTGCQRLTDVEEKNYILSMYVDYSSDEENAYQFWIARANLSEMEGQSDEIPCQITKIGARNLQQLEEKYLETVPGKTEWNHIYTIFLGSGIASNKTACTHLLKEWDNEWQKSPNVLLALCLENPKKLYKIKNIPAGAAGQEINLLAEQNKEKYSGQICETPIDYLRAKQQKEDKITLYRVTIENGNLKIMTDEL